MEYKEQAETRLDQKIRRFLAQFLFSIGIVEKWKQNDLIDSGGLKFQTTIFAVKYFDWIVYCEAIALCKDCLTPIVFRKDDGS